MPFTYEFIDNGKSLGVNFNGQSYTAGKSAVELTIPDLAANNVLKIRSNSATPTEFVVYLDTDTVTGVGSGSTTATELRDALEAIFFLDDTVEWGNIEGDINNQTDLPFTQTQSLVTFDRDVQFPNQSVNLGGAKTVGATNELLVATNTTNGEDFNYLPEVVVENKLSKGVCYVDAYEAFDKNSPQGQAQPSQTTTISSQPFTETITGLNKHYASVVIPFALGNIITYNWYIRSSTGFVNGFLKAYKSINLDPNSTDEVWSTATINDVKTFSSQPATSDNVLINESASVNADIQIPLLKDGFFQKNGETLTFQLICDEAFELEAGLLPDGQGGSFVYPYIVVDGVNWREVQSANIDPNTGKIPVDLLPYSDEGKYRGLWNANTNTPNLTTLNPAAETGDFFYVSEAGTYNGVDYGLNDIIKYNGVDYDLIKDPNVQINDIVNAALSEYDVYVDSNYTGDVKTGSSLQPYTDLETAIANTGDGESILVLGTHIISTTITLPSDKSLYFYGTDTTNIKYASYVETNNNIFYQSVTNCDKEYFFDNIKFSNAGAYAVYVLSAKEVRFKGCEFFNNGWDGTGLSTVLADDGTNLGYDSSQADLQAFYAGSSASNGGAMRIQNTTIVSVVDCEIYNNLRGLRIQDCGVGGYGYISRNQCYNNIESGIYLASSTYNATKGCENFTVYNNASKYNANNGILVVGGINNIVSLNIVEGNWNAGIMGWHVSNTRFRDLDLTNNNRSEFNGIGNTGDAHSSITIGGNTARTERSFIADVLATEVYNTGLGSNTSRIGFQILEDVQEITDDYGKTLINIDNVGFKDQDYAIDSLANLDVVKLTIGDCRYIDTVEKDVNVLNGYYYELPYSNHHTNIKDLDISLDDTTSQIILKEGVGGNVVNPYAINTLQAIAFGTKIRIILKGSKKIQLEVDVANTSIDGSMVSSVLSQALVQINDVFTNTSGFATGGDPVTAFTLIGDDLTITLQSGTSYTVDVTTLGVDENKFVVSGALNGSNLELTMNDSTIVTIDASNMINGSTLPAISNDWFIAYGNNAGDEVEAASIVNTYENQQPFYNGDFLEKGEEYVWTHDSNGYYLLGIYTGPQATTNEVEITYGAKWSNAFIFTNVVSNRVSENSVGVDVASRYASGYAITNNTVFALAYDSDNYLKLYDISNGDRVLIGQSNVALVGDSQVISFGGQNQPNAKFPVMVKRYAEWTLVHDFDNSETSIIDGLEEDSVIKSNMSISPGEKFMVNIDFQGRGSRFGIGYDSASSGNANAHYDIDFNIIYSTAEQFTANDPNTEWTFNPNNTYYQSTLSGWWWRGGGNAGMISLRYNSDNSLELWSEDDAELIATKNVDLDGSPIHFFFGVNENTTSDYIPSISKQTLGQGSQPITNFAPDISDQSFDITEGASFNVQIALDSGSDIVNIYGEEDAPSWAVLNQETGVFNGTAPAYNGTTDSYVISCKAANALGGITSFTVTLNVQELTYTNSKSLFFEDGVSSYLGGNAALITSMERASNGSGSTDAWSISLWIKGSTANSGQTIFYFGANDVVNNGHVELRQTNHNGAKRLRLRYGTNGNHLQFTTPSGSITPSSWQHVLITYDGGETGVSSGSMSTYYGAFKIYIDGVLQSTSNTHSNFGYSGSVVGQNFRFGRFASGTYPKDMTYNQMAIWGSDQSANVSDIYNGGVTQDLSLLTDAPEHYYEIETSTSTVQDLIGTAHLVGYNFSSGDLVNDAP